MALRVRRLIWDSWNVPHMARHAVTPDEVEERCHGPFLTLTGYAERILVLGPTAAGRMLVAVLEPAVLEPAVLELVEPEVYYVVTARPASRKERRYYLAQSEGEHP